MLKDFKNFILRGNVIDLAVGIVIGAAFVAVVESFVGNLLTPLIGIPGGVDFSNLQFTVNGSPFRYGAFINDVITFLLTASAVFFFVVRPVNKLMDLRKTGHDVASQSRPCDECLSNIPKAAKRCAFCGSPQPVEG